MKLISWNCHGMGNASAVRGLLDLQKQEDPDILFLAETKMDTRKIEKFRWMLGLANMVCKSCVGKSGGLALFWRKCIYVNLQTMSKYFIDATVTTDEGSWRFTGLYGEPNSKKKAITW
jgi:exonuclease III